MAEVIALPDIYQRIRIITDSKGVSSSLKGATSSVSSAIDTLQRSSQTKLSKVANSVGRAGTSLSLGLTAPIVVGIQKSISASVTFQAEMMKLHTQAGYTLAQVAALSQQVIQVAPSTGQGPLELAKMLYHVASAGVKANKAMGLVTQGANLMTVGGGNADATMQAMIAVNVSGIKGAGSGKNAAAAYLNGIVGSGDMRMPQLSNAIGTTAILPEFKAAGLTLKDFGAAEATLTDNAMPAAQAAMHLRQMVTAMEAPSTKARKALSAIGISSTQLAEDMRQPNGLLVAMTDLKSHLNKPLSAEFQGQISYAKASLAGLGITAKEQTTVMNELMTGNLSGAKFSLKNDGVKSSAVSNLMGNLNANSPQFMAASKTIGSMGLSAKQATSMINTLGPNAVEQAAIVSSSFGGVRSSSAVFTMLGEMPRLKSKYSQLTTASKTFGDSVKGAHSTAAFQMQAMNASMDSLKITMGTMLLPIVSSLTSSFGSLFSMINKLPASTKKFGVYLGLGLAALGPGMKMAKGAYSAGSAIKKVGKATKLIGLTRDEAIIKHLQQMEKDKEELEKQSVLDANKTVGKTTGAFGKASKYMQGSFKKMLRSMGLMKTAQAESVVSTEATVVASGEETVALEGQTVATEGATTVTEEMNTAMLGNPFVAVAVVVIALAAGIYELYKHSKTFRTLIKELMKWLKDTAIMIWHKFRDAIKDVGNWLESIGAWMASAWDTISRDVSKVWNTIYNFIRTHMKLIIAIILGPIGLLIDFLLSNWNTIAKIFKDAFAIINKIVQIAVAILEIIIVGTFDAIRDTVEAIWQAFADVLSAAWDLFSTAIQAAWSLLVSVATTVWNSITGAISVIWSAVWDAMTLAWHIFMDFLNLEWKGLVAIATTAWNLIINPILAVWNYLWTGIQGVWNGITSWISKEFSTFETTAQNLWRPIWVTLIAVWDALPQAVSASWDWIKKVVVGGINDVLKLVNGFIDGINSIAKDLHIGVNISQIGLIGEPSSGASGMPAAASPPGLKAGGFVTNGPQVIVGEGKKAWPEYVIPTDPAYRGRALGLFKSLGGRLMAKGGILGTLENIGSDVLGGAFSIVKDVAIKPIEALLKLGVGALPDGIAKMLGNGIVNIFAGITGTASKSGKSSGPPSGPLPSGDLKTWLEQAIQVTGVSQGWLSGLGIIAQNESSGNPRAINNWDINAKNGDPSKGLMQVISTTFKEYEAAGHNDIWNPVDNAASAINYIKSRYGDINNVPGVRSVDRGGAYMGYRTGGVLPFGSYDSGGYLPEGLSIAHNGTGRPEPVGHGLGGVVISPGAIVVTVNGSASGADVTHAMHSALEQFVRELEMVVTTH